MFGDSSFWSWVSHVMEWEGAHAPHCSVVYALPFFKNGADSTDCMLQVIYTCLLVKGVFINLLLNHGVRGLQGIYFFASTQVASVGCMCSVIVHFLHCICVCHCDGCHESLIVLSRSVMVRCSHLLARCYLGTMCMCTTPRSRDPLETCATWETWNNRP
jgi:hypothetical protein